MKNHILVGHYILDIYKPIIGKKLNDTLEQETIDVTETVEEYEVLKYIEDYSIEFSLIFVEILKNLLIEYWLNTSHKESGYVKIIKENVRWN